MEAIIDFFLHIDKHLLEAVVQYGVWIYLILFIIVFCETGLVVTPFLPGDSLLFAAGALAALGHLDISLLFSLLFVAAVIGDFVNYHVGKLIGLTVFKPEAKIFKSSYLDKTHDFYERYGGKTIILARFVPIIRTFAPFVAGASKMSYKHFAFFNISGALLWVVSMLASGYIFGQLDFVKNHFSVIVLGIIFVSVLPMAVEILLAYKRKKQTNIEKE